MARAAPSADATAHRVPASSISEGSTHNPHATAGTANAATTTPAATNQRHERPTLLTPSLPVSTFPVI
ncbi:hypothetical protein OG871_39380 [Kitasatospora sp. NBC_00374]|uniref:hypothetical protein n=1 Tax=Kitasatospora sp. NBC_00374 TaxID=2975964 RepID=UPI0030E5C68B